MQCYNEIENDYVYKASSTVLLNKCWLILHYHSTIEQGSRQVRTQSVFREWPVEKQNGQAGLQR